MMLLRASAVLYFFCSAGGHASEVTMRPRGTGGGVYTPTYGPIVHSPPTKAPTTEAPSPIPTESPTAKLDYASIRPSPVTLTPDELSSSNVPSSAVEPVAECMTRAGNHTGLSRLSFLVAWKAPLSDTVVPFLFRLRESLQTFVATDLLGCRLRPIVDDSMNPIRDVQFDLAIHNSTFATNSSCTNCTDIDIYIDVYYEEGWNTSQIDAELFETLASHCSQIALMAGVQEISDSCRYMSILGPDGTIQFLDNLLNPPDAEDTDGDLVAQEDNISTFGVTALSFSALVVVLGILVASKRRTRAHVKDPKENENVGEYMTNDLEAGSSSSGSSSDHSLVVKDGTSVYPSDLTVSDGTPDISLFLGSQLRFVTVEEESDSVTSSWSGVSIHPRASNRLYPGSVALSGSTPDDHSTSTGRSYQGLSVQSGRAYRARDTVQL